MSYILGANSVNNFIADDQHLYVPASNKIVVCNRGSDDVSVWEATDGKYELDKIAVNSTGIMCLTEIRLQVGLLFYDVSKRQKIYEIPNIASTRVKSLEFSESDVLFVFGEVPEPFVQVLKVTAEGKYVVLKNLTLPLTSVSRIAPSLCSGCDGDFFALHGRSVSGFSELSNFTDFYMVSDADSEITSLLSLPNGLLFAKEDGRLLLKLMDDHNAVEVALFDCTVCSMVRFDDKVVVGCGDGSLHSVTLGSFIVTKLVDGSLSSPASRLVVSSSQIIAGTKQGIVLIPLPESTTETLPLTVRNVFPSSTVSVKPITGGCVVTCRDGSFLSIVNGKYNIFSRNAGTSLDVIDSCVVTNNCLILLCANGELRGCSTADGRELWCESVAPDSSHCESNDQGFLLVHTCRSIMFFKVSGSTCTALGSVTADMKSDIQFLRWIPGSDCFLVICQSGEIYTLRFPSDAPPCVIEHSIESVVADGSWWLDFPIRDLLICFYENEILNVLVHSADKDTKLYALERKRDADPTKVTRPHFLMRDHESGGTCLGQLDKSTIFSAGRDGTVVLRDIAHYQTKLSPIPPSKEKRKPTEVLEVRQFGKEGIASVSVLPGPSLVCTGNDGVVHVISISTPHLTSWTEAVWTTKKILPVGEESEVATVGSTDRSVEVRSHLLATIEDLRKKWKEAMKSKNPEIPLSALLVPQQKEEFEKECEEAIHDMKEKEYYRSLMNEYTQDKIRELCYDTMEVGRCKVSSILVPDLAVHNFHIPKVTKEQQPLGKKIAFLRKLQVLSSSGRRFENLFEEGTESEEDPFVSDASRALMRPQDVYTLSRCVTQAVLLRLHALTLRENFNVKFKNLVERKKSVVSLIEERSQRCVKIFRQLGEAPEGLFTPFVDPEEDMDTLFSVTDDELPEEVRSLLPRTGNVTVYSPVNEAALKHWMDGLEKDVEVVQVNLKPPEFADESSENYVPADERTEEQLRLFEEYEKKLKEETESVNLRREALRHELENLQKEIQDSAQTIDGLLNELREHRLLVSERIEEAEIRRINVLQHLLRYQLTFSEFSKYNEEQETLQKSLTFVKVLLESKRSAANSTLNDLEALEEEYAQYLPTAREQPPFNDTQYGEKLFRRINRWKNKYDDGKADLPDPNTPVDELPNEIWEMFCLHCEELHSMLTEIRALEEKHKTQSAEFDTIHTQVSLLESRLEETNYTRQNTREKFLFDMLNTSFICRLHQGQIQDERATTYSSFQSSSLRWSDDVRGYNDLILESFSESTSLLQKIAKREKMMKQSRWETEQLRYSVGTLEMELRHLHTLRVTRQMQEWLSGDADVSEEKTILDIEKHKDFVNKTMKKKLDDLVRTAQRLKSQINERSVENRAIGTQFQSLKGTVEDLGTVKSMVDAHADGSEHYAKRAKEIYEVSELEELARAQQEELFRLKKEVDRLRERTFPSFAVVSKRTI